MGEGTYLVGHQCVLTHCGLLLLLTSSHDVGNVVYMIFQQPFEGLTFVLAKLNRIPAQNEPIITGVPALRENAVLRFSLHLLWLLRRRPSASTLAGLLFQSLLRGLFLQLPSRGLTEGRVTFLMKRTKNETNKVSIIFC